MALRVTGSPWCRPCVWLVFCTDNFLALRGEIQWYKTPPKKHTYQQPSLYFISKRVRSMINHNFSTTAPGFITRIPVNVSLPFLLCRFLLLVGVRYCILLAGWAFISARGEVRIAQFSPCVFFGAPHWSHAAVGQSVKTRKVRATRYIFVFEDGLFFSAWTSALELSRFFVSTAVPFGGTPLSFGGVFGRVLL